MPAPKGRRLNGMGRGGCPRSACQPPTAISDKKIPGNRSSLLLETRFPGTKMLSGAVAGQPKEEEMSIKLKLTLWIIGLKLHLQVRM